MLVAGEEEFDALAVAGEGVVAIAAVHGAVEVLVGFEQVGRHGQRVVKVGERSRSQSRFACWEIPNTSVAKARSRLQDSLGKSLYVQGLFAGWLAGPREIVIDEFVGVAVVRFEAAGHLANPGHVH